VGINPAMAKPQPKPYIHHGGTESRRKIGGKQNQKQDQNPRTAENTEKVNSAGRTALLRAKPARDGDPASRRALA